MLLIPVRSTFVDRFVQDLREVSKSPVVECPIGAIMGDENYAKIKAEIEERREKGDIFSSKCYVFNQTTYPIVIISFWPQVARDKKNNREKYKPRKAVRRVALHEQEQIMIKSATSKTHGKFCEKIAVNTNDFIASSVKIGPSATAEIYGLCKTNACVMIDRLRKSGADIPLMSKHAQKAARRQAQLEASINLGREVEDPAEANIPKSPPPPPERKFSPPPPPPPPANPIHRGGTGDRRRSMMMQVPEKLDMSKPLPVSKPVEPLKHKPSPIVRIKEEKLNLPDFEDRPREPVPEILKRAVIVNPENRKDGIKTATSKTTMIPATLTKPRSEGHPRFGKARLNLDEIKILNDKTLYLYFSETQSRNVWIFPPMFVILDPAPEFTQYLHFAASVSVSYEDELVEGLRRLHSDMHFLGTGKLIRKGRLRMPGKPQKDYDDDE